MIIDEKFDFYFDGQQGYSDLCSNNTSLTEFIYITTKWCENDWRYQELEFCKYFLLNKKQQKDDYTK